MIFAEEQKRIYWDRKTAQLCVRCGAALGDDVDTVHCASCSQKRKDRKAAIAAEGPTIHRGALKPMVCVTCLAKITATIGSAKYHGWRVWVGGALCKSCVGGLS